MVNTEVKSTPDNEKPSRIIILGILILLLIAVLAYGYKKTHPTNSVSSNLSPGWLEYKSEKYGFKFSYPTNWGSPSIHETKAGNGKTYSIDFNKNNSKSTNTMAITMQSEDITTPDCKSNCGLSRMSIKKQLLSNDSFVKKDESSYSIVSTEPQMKVQSALNIDSVVDIPRIKVSAADVLYLIQGTYPDCLDNKISVNTDTNCITQSEYETSLKVLRSLVSN